MKAEEETRMKLQLEAENGKLYYVNSSIRTEKSKNHKPYALNNSLTE